SLEASQWQRLVERRRCPHVWIVHGQCRDRRSRRYIMLSYDDRRAIEGLFDRLAQVERQNPHRDPEAEQMIDDSIRRQPNAPYYLAQTVVVQQAALEEADRRIQDLEAKLRTQLTDGR